MIGILIAESNNTDTSEKRFFIGMKEFFQNKRVGNLLLIRDGFYSKPNSFKDSLHELTNNPSIQKVFVVCDNENNKIERTKAAIEKASEEIPNPEKVVFATKDSPPGYNFEIFLGSYTNLPSIITTSNHKSEKDPFVYFGTKYHQNFKKTRHIIHFKNFLVNLSRDDYIGQIINDIILYVNANHPDIW